ncbi:hypothetical protein LJB42_002348 [Komagataella kurtzmanii]|nr:hypothetical protein LJB42_002348 [Komagataella kurtzmanii]
MWSKNAEPIIEPQTVRIHSLSRDACLTPKGVRSFLKLSRLSTDDVLKQQLNNKLNHHESTYSNRKKEKSSICNVFFESSILPAWEARSNAIEFCHKEAVKFRQEIKSEESQINRRNELVDTRIDPYALRDLQQELEEKYLQVDQLLNWVNNEKTIEQIVRSRSIGMLQDTCQLDSDSPLVKRMNSCE